MKTRIEVTHKGITIRIRNDTTVVNGKEYTNYIIPESTSGKLVRHKRASLQEAKQKAKDICEEIAGNKKEVMSWDDIKFAEVRRHSKSCHDTASDSIRLLKLCSIASAMLTRT